MKRYDINELRKKSEKHQLSATEVEVYNRMKRELGKQRQRW